MVQRNGTTVIVYIHDEKHVYTYNSEASAASHAEAWITYINNLNRRALMIEHGYPN